MKSQAGDKGRLISREDRADGAGVYVVRLAKAPGTFIVPSGDDGRSMVNGTNYTGSVQRGDLDLWSFTANAVDYQR